MSDDKSRPTHGRPSDAVVERGNVLLIDFGCIVDGYRSDMTRTMFVGEVSSEIRRYHDAVREAQALAIAGLRHGVNGQEVDAVARERIAREGVEPYGHGLGHGIGLETHEPPSLRKSVAFTVEAGMVFSALRLSELYIDRERNAQSSDVEGLTHEEIAALFGSDVAAIVAEVTDDKRLPKLERKRLQVATAAKKNA